MALFVFILWLIVVLALHPSKRVKEETTKNFPISLKREAKRRCDRED